MLHVRAGECWFGWVVVEDCTIGLPAFASTGAVLLQQHADSLAYLLQALHLYTAVPLFYRRGFTIYNKQAQGEAQGRSSSRAPLQLTRSGGESVFGSANDRTAASRLAAPLP